MKEGTTEPRMISFVHLYDSHFAHLPKYSSDERGWIIFPQDFIPDTKKKYDCMIQWTMFGYFKFNGKNYKVARAHLSDRGGIIDKIDYKHDVVKKEERKQKTAMELAFKNALLKKR